MSVLVDNTPDLPYRTDLEGRIIFVSGAVEDLSRYTVEEAIGMKMAEEVYLNPEDRINFLELLQKKVPWGYIQVINVKRTFSFSCFL